MSIVLLREQMNRQDVTMRYEDGGAVEVYKIGDREIKFAPGVSTGEVIAAFKDAE